MAFETVNTPAEAVAKPTTKAAGQNYGTATDLQNVPNLPIQFQLTVGAADDPYEREADTMAEKVMRMPGSGYIQQCADCERKIQREENDEEPVAKEELASQSPNPDYQGFRTPFFERNAMHLWDPQSALGVWNYNFSFFKRFGLDDSWSGKAANLTTPFFINSQLKVQNPTWWEITDQQLNTTSIDGSLPIFSFDADFKNWKPLPFIQKKSTETNTIRKCDCDQEEKNGAVQRKPLGAEITPFVQKKSDGDGSSISNSLNSRIMSSMGNGSSLDQPTASFMNSRFGVDFSAVKVHTDTAAIQMNRELNAKAFTVGSDVFFNHDQYQPSTYDGKKLIAHELTHVVQQGHAKSPDTLNRQISFIQKKEEDKKFFSAVKEIDQGNKKIKVERIITRAECKSKNGSLAATGGLKNNKIMFEASTCKNDVTGEASGNIDFGEFVDSADQLIKSLPSLSMSANAGDKLAEEVEKNFKDDKLRASLKLTLRVNHFRIEAKGTGGGNLNGENEGSVDGIIRYANGKINIELGGGFSKVWDQLKSPGDVKVHLYTDIGPIILRIDGKYNKNDGASVEGKIFDTDLSKKVGFSVKYDDKDGDKKVTFNLVFTIPEKIPTENAPSCVTCQCETPQIDYRCTEHQKKEEPVVEEPKIIPLFYNYATAEPRNDEEVPKEVYTNTIDQIVDDIKKGYTIKQIEGYTSPEGSLGANIPGRFEGNKSLSQKRAVVAKDAIRDAVQKAKANFNRLLVMRDGDNVKTNLENALNTDPLILPMDEMHGGDQANADIKESKLFDHLIKELKAPDEGELDILEKENAIGKALPEELRDLAEKDVASFRTGLDGKRKLKENQRLQKLYPWMRRALVFLSPPEPVRKPFIFSEAWTNFTGTPVPCTEEHIKLFANEPMPENEKLFINNCKGK